MAVSVSKGGNVSLSYDALGLTDIDVGLACDAWVADGA
jgi:tellurium resistance protein TerD